MFHARFPAHGRPRLRRARTFGAQAGFTLVELVVVMTLVAVIASMASARFADRDPFAVQGVADQLVSGLRLGQAVAIAQRLPVYVVLGASPASLSMCFDAACTQPLPTPDVNATWLAEASDLRLSTAGSFSFQPNGAPSFASLLQVQVQNADASVSSQPVSIEAVSGHVHSP